MEKGTTDGILRNGLLERVTEERGTSKGNDKRVVKEVGRETKCLMKTKQSTLRGKELELVPQRGLKE